MMVVILMVMRFFCFEINDYNQSNSSHETNPISDIVFTNDGDKMYITEKGSTISLVYSWINTIMFLRVCHIVQESLNIFMIFNSWNGTSQNNFLLETTTKTTIQMVELHLVQERLMVAYKRRVVCFWISIKTS